MKNILLLSAALAFSTAALAAGDPDAGQAKAATCATCHGPAGVSTTPSFPTLAGQHQTYLVVAMEQYKSGERKNPIMAGQVAGLSGQDIADLAAYFARQDGPLGIPSY